MTPIQLEAKYKVFDSLEQMLAPETLSELLATRVARVDYQPIEGHSGLAGSELRCVDTDAGQFVFKRMSMNSDWIMFVSDDILCRSVTVWQYGLLDRLRPHIEHKIIACCRDGDGWALLMEDLSGHTYAWDKPIAPDLVPVFLAALARMHAIFWNDENLADPRLGLLDAVKLLGVESFPAAQQYRHLSLGVIPEWIIAGWEVMERLLGADVYASLRSLAENPGSLVDALNRLPRTLLHFDYRAENLAYTGQPVVLDWQGATCSLMTIDLFWFIRHGYVEDVMGTNGAILFYRRCLETYLNQRFDDKEWRIMVDLGRLVDALRSTCFTAYWHLHSDDPATKRWNLRDVKRRNKHVRAGMRWL